jgi:hypothetical protein
LLVDVSLDIGACGWVGGNANEVRHASDEFRG